MRKLLMLVVVVVVAAFALSAPASANTMVSVKTEPGGNSCTTSTCTAHVISVGTIELEAHVFLFHTHYLDCNNEYILNVNASGAGTLSNFSFTGGDPECEEIAPCDTPWGFTGEELGGSTAELAVNVCFQTLVECDGFVDITLQDNGDHVYTASAVDQRIPSPAFGVDCEITGNWEIENPNFEIMHSDD